MGVAIAFRECGSDKIMGMTAGTMYMSVWISDVLLYYGLSLWSRLGVLHPVIYSCACARGGSPTVCRRQTFCMFFLL